MTTTNTMRMAASGNRGDTTEGAPIGLGDSLEGRRLHDVAAAHVELRSLDRLLLVAAPLIDADDGDPMKVAVRVAVEQLRRQESPLRRECLTFAAEQLEDARARWQLRTLHDEVIIELLRAACLARTGREGDAASLVDAARRQMQAALQRRDDELARLDASNDPGAPLRAATLREEPMLSLVELDDIAKACST